MNRKRRTLLLLFVPLAVLMAVSAGVTYGNYRQQRLNQDLIAALKRGDVAAEVRLLNDGADANACDMGDQPVTVWGVLRNYWQRLRTGNASEKAFHEPALWVFSKSLRPDLWDKFFTVRTVPLLDHGANINSQNELQLTWLNFACIMNDPATALFLIKRGANVNTPHNDGRTPLMWAGVHNNLELVKALLKAGADVNKKDNRGFTPLSWASVGAEVPANKQEIIRILKQAGARMNTP